MSHVMVSWGSLSRAHSPEVSSPMKLESADAKLNARKTSMSILALGSPSLPVVDMTPSPESTFTILTAAASSSSGSFDISANGISSTLGRARTDQREDEECLRIRI